MNKKEIIDQMQSGDVVAYSGIGLISFLIKCVTKSKYSHVALVWRLNKRVLLLEATFLHGVSLRELDDGDFYWIKTDIKWNDEIEDRAFDKLEKLYSVLDAIKVGLGLNPSKHGEICTYFIDDCLDLSRELGSPGKLVDHFVKQGKKVVYVPKYTTNIE